MWPKYLFLVVVLNFVFVSGYNESYFGRHGRGNQVFGGKECTKTGFMCETCELVVFCFKLPNGEWIKEEAESCKNGQSCQQSTGTCSTTPDFECDPSLSKYRFTCNQVGLFPDAFNCKNYHMCTLNTNGEVMSISVELFCPEGYGYDPLSTQCKNALKNDKCNNPLVQPCRKVGESGPIKANPSLYYTCLPTDIDGDKINFPHMFYCSGRKEYIDNKCQDPTPSGLQDGKCIGKGNFYDPSDCKKYIECTGAGKDPLPRSCSSGYRFDPKSQSCVLFTCENYNN